MAQVLRLLPEATDQKILVGTATRDDAAVYRLTPKLALVSTIDFFSPIVDDPYAFGAIAAANALSDVYAMGGKPLFALNVVGFPPDKLDMSVLADILRGGADKAAEAGISIIGGHSVKDPEPKYGLAVTGVVDPENLIRNVGARPGDVLFLTKPIGTGILSTAIKRGSAGRSDIETAMALMATLNRSSAEAMLEVGVSAATDVSGFGLLGHLTEITTASGVGARIRASAVPLLGCAEALAREGIVPGGTRVNQSEVEALVHWDDAVEPVTRVILCDAQTSGGLLMAVAADRASELEQALRSRGSPVVARIGEVVSGEVVEVIP